VGRQRRRLARTNYDLSNTRATTQTPINSQTVSKLKLKWRFAFKGSSGFGAFASTPIVLNGTVYLQDLNSNVYALDRSTGKLEWKHAFNKPSVGPNGVAYGYGRVYGATSTSAFALDPHTGKLLWSRKLIRNRNEGIDMTPQLYDNTVVFSTVPGNASSFYKGNGDGIVWALDVATGSRSGSSTPSPTAPSCGATQRSTAAAGSGTRPRSTARDGSSSRSPTRRRSMERRSTRTARAGLAPTSTPTRSSPSTGRPERCSGTSRLSATTCATTT
jgi:glucose dehydrogenase